MTASFDQIAKVWDAYATDMDELLEIAESRVTRQLTTEGKRNMEYWISDNDPIRLFSGVFLDHVGLVKVYLRFLFYSRIQILKLFKLILVKISIISNPKIVGRIVKKSSERSFKTHESNK
ncbi:hypothetical protein CMK12_06870 [Candidatus Poribacteria bacterium]|nr:hypothetical protein [Candidatus Poribacteria bacterium]MDP6598678.1 hypothetical protein [Candidatus Poribacteria bacterium]MDP6751185.1 hypothetical protein [Candidatus Poribacteria bacterium]MDP7000188.1 hypothetical protein [Candidatus Poribacteria bacterium]